MYSDITELARVLKIRSATTEQEAALTRALTAASIEIDKELDRSVDDDDLTTDELLLVDEVALDRAVEHWQQSESPFGIVGLGDGTAIYTSRDSWNRHALKLAPLKTQWGLA